MEYRGYKIYRSGGDLFCQVGEVGIYQRTHEGMMEAIDRQIRKQGLGNGA